jgi:N-acetylneuraminic acid mutarotase
VVLFGGEDSNRVALGDTWDFDGSIWTQRSTSGPPARYGAAAATLNGKFVLFGGAIITDAGLYDPMDDTWEWDGSSWTQRNVAGPAARFGAAAASLNGKVVLFGGRGTQNWGDTWEWDGSTWTQMTTSPSPSPRSNMAVATLGGKVVIFGGTADGVTDFSETWEWDGASWRQRMLIGPPARSGASAAVASGTVFLFGGFDDTNFAYFADTWAWDGRSWMQRPELGPKGREYAAFSGL